jgi:hypothetical protein
MPSSIDSVGRLITLIRKQLAARPPLPVTQRTPTGKAAGSGVNPSRPENLESLVGQRIKQIDRNDSQRGRKAFRVFLESILLASFGEQLMNDPKFYQLVDDVQMSMESDPETNALVNTAIAHLLSEIG